MLMDNFHLVEIILISWKIYFELCRLHSYDIIMMSRNMNSLTPMKDQNTQRKKCDDVYIWKNNYTTFHPSTKRLHDF